MSKTSWEDIERLTRFCKAYRERRPNSPIVRGVKSGEDDPIHLDIADLEMLVEAARDQLPIRDKMRFYEAPAWAFNPDSQRVERRIEACL